MSERESVDDPVLTLRLFVQEYFDGSFSRCLELDQLLWEVRLAKHHEPQMLHQPPVGAPDLYDDLFS